MCFPNQNATFCVVCLQREVPCVTFGYLLQIKLKLVCFERFCEQTTEYLVLLNRAGAIRLSPDEHIILLYNIIIIAILFTFSTLDHEKIINSI